MDRTANRRRTTTSRATERSRRFLSSRRAFTLIEVLLVLAIVAMVMAIGLPAISRVTYQRLNSTTRQFVGMIRSVRNDAILLNQVHRLAVDFDKKQYWIEQQKSNALLNENEAPVDRKKQKKGDAPPPSDFVIVEKYSKGPKEMPGGTQITSILKERDGLRNEGIAYIHFFPNGFNEQAIIHLSREGEGHVGFSLVIKPTSSRIDLVREILKTFDIPAQQ